MSSEESAPISSQIPDTMHDRSLEIMVAANIFNYESGSKENSTCRQYRSYSPLATCLFKTVMIPFTTIRPTAVNPTIWCSQSSSNKNATSRYTLLFSVVFFLSPMSLKRTVNSAESRDIHCSWFGLVADSKRTKNTNMTMHIRCCLINSFESLRRL